LFFNNVDVHDSVSSCQSRIASQARGPRATSRRRRVPWHGRRLNRREIPDLGFRIPETPSSGTRHSPYPDRDLHRAENLRRRVLMSRCISPSVFSEGWRVDSAQPLEMCTRFLSNPPGASRQWRGGRLARLRDAPNRSSRPKLSDRSVVDCSIRRQGASSRVRGCFNRMNAILMHRCDRRRDRSAPHRNHGYTFWGNQEHHRRLNWSGKKIVNV
jgi:hypothetical protein